MNFFIDLKKQSLYALFSGLFLIAGAKTDRLPIIDSINKPNGTATFATSVEEKPRLETISTSSISEISTNYQSSTHSYTASTTSPTSTAIISAPSGNYITFAGHSVPIFISYDTMTDSGASAGLYNGRFLYGHNAANVFGALPYLGLDTTISVTLNGQTSTYTIAYQITLEKSITQNYMRAITNARFEGTQYTYALMTCSGISYGNGDASHRTIIFIK